MRNADLTRSQLQGAEFPRAILVGATLAETNLNGADLNSAILTAADLRSAHLDHTKMFGMFAHGAVFDGASFSGAELEPHDFDSARLLTISEPRLAVQASKSNKLAKLAISAPNSSELQHLEKDLEELACSEQGVARGIIRNSFISRRYLGDYVKDIAEKFFNWQTGCESARDLSQSDLKTLHDRLNAINR